MSSTELRKQTARNRSREWIARQMAADPEGFRLRQRDKMRAYHKRHRSEKNLEYKKRMIFQGARERASKRDLEFSISIDSISWPTRCPVLGIELNYFNSGGHKPDSPSLDRFDNTKGYVSGNVFVISNRANSLKNNASPDELMRVALYAARRLA